MAAITQAIALPSALPGKVVGDYSSKPPRSERLSSSPRTRGFGLPRSKSFRAFRKIQKSPRLTRSGSRVLMRICAAPTAMLGSDNCVVTTSKGFESFASKGFGNFLSKKAQGDEEIFKFDDEDDDEEGPMDEMDSSPSMLDTVNAVLADVVDGQKYIRETGRTKPRPMKRRSLVVSLALGAMRDPLNSVESRLGSMRRTPSAARLTRSPSSSGFARTAQLMSELSFGSPRSQI